MGCDIHAFVEEKVGTDWERVLCADEFHNGADVPFDWRGYGMFGFLAGVRNYSVVTPISKPRGLPEDVSAGVKVDYDIWESNAHSESWLTVRELLDFDYDAEMEDRRCTRQLAANMWSGAETCEPGEGKKMSYREFLGEAFFKDLKTLENLGKPEDIRVVFWFDN